MQQYLYTFNSLFLSALPLLASINQNSTRPSERLSPSSSLLSRPNLQVPTPGIISCLKRHFAPLHRPLSLSLSLTPLCVPISQNHINERERERGESIELPFEFPLRLRVCVGMARRDQRVRVRAPIDEAQRTEGQAFKVELYGRARVPSFSLSLSLFSFSLFRRSYI